MPKKKSKSKSKKQGTAKSTLSLKEQLAEKRKAAKERKELISFSTSAVFGAAFIGMMAFPLSGPKGAMGTIAGIICLAFSFKYPRQALWAFLIYMPFSGTIIYSLGNSPVLQLAKDGFFIPGLITIIQECQRKRLPIIIPKDLKPWLMILLACCLMTLFFVNGSQQMTAKPPEKPFAMGILGLKVLMGYIPLITCAYYLIRNKKDFLLMTRLHVFLALICFGLCFVQYMFLVTGRCAGTQFLEGADLFKASLEARCLVGGSLLYSPSQGVIRLPGTFVAPWQWGWFIIANAYFTFATAFSDPSARWRTVGLLGMAADFVIAVISGQRIALLLAPLSMVILLVLTGQIFNLKRFLPIAIGLGVVLGIAATLYPEVVQERIDSFLGRWEASPADDFIVYQFEFTWKNLKGSMIGLGLGRATNSARVFGYTALIETWFPKVMHEIGPVGLIAFLALVTSLTVFTFKAYRSLQDPSLRSFGACFWVFILFISYQTYYYPLDVDPVAVYYWFFAGVLLKLPELDKQEKINAELENQLSKKNKKNKRLANSVATE
ncbi:hormogonium polysaccharide biosynthesis protein HpsL [Argonema antarcticum]|uniref:hormogonium polysaccharide biosynthesis protein HpsL n=1 Tax=Argonema antarcticum TaxID=2942763 RepID=UPI002012C8B0|nr:hormogonium polysaccharide biosynthesis protein HpsL [Argonema antarcticum]MCL1473517.1 hormogonium polysaccharide biosynthesis protein HpsL [Argonema antarcticum A004/B2]